MTGEDICPRTRPCCAAWLTGSVFRNVASCFRLAFLKINNAWNVAVRPIRRVDWRRASGIAANQSEGTGSVLSCDGGPPRKCQHGSEARARSSATIIRKRDLGPGQVLFNYTPELCIRHTLEVMGNNTSFCNG